ncbi:RAMP superfamily CRISPR-associated protein [Sphaerotilus sp.]|uniref:RAMP superfamily CRISPR-associated protein n=1 Tax=Sphaerotilus sp. TaxID=2093942 RepID=UPI00286DD433|nr:RAMP superfamily CRISPR-associated protein [Sphaerotilus sp.]
MTTTRHTTLAYRLSFNTPAFLGNAEQQGQWRTPPIKALIRQWWRVAYAADQPRGVNVTDMRRAEGQLFGVAADGKGESTRSLVRIRLSAWAAGTLKSWDNLEQPPVHHCEVERTGYKVGPHAYLGFGPLDGRGGTRFGEKVNAAIAAAEKADLSIAFPSEEKDRLYRAFWLLQHYGTLGGRSRNGWGSFGLTPCDGAPAFEGGLDKALTLPWRDALQTDWPHAIGADAKGPLIWQTEVLADWKAVMRRLAEIKIGLRTQFKFPQDRPDGRIHDRHWLSYPVTNHAVRDWGNNARLPNSLRFKVRATPDGKLMGVVFHVPCLPPAQFQPQPVAITRVWEQVHSHLDDVARLKRLPA